MDAPNGQYRFTKLESVVFGPGAVRSLGRELERRGLKRALVITGKTLGSSKLLKKVLDAAEGKVAATFAGSRQHVPSETVKTASAEAARIDADSLISFGGGSPIDTAKAVAMAEIERGRELLQIAIPTTLSAGEYTPFGGVTDEKTRRKGGVGDPRLQPRVVILDPELTVETPAWLWASTGVKALDHANEASYSARHNPVSDALASRAIRLLNAHLPASTQGGADEIAHRGECQLAAWMSIFGAINTMLGLSHALGHQIGARWDVPHGVTSCITVPHVMRLMADVASERFAPIAEGFEVRFDFAGARLSALECANRAERFIQTLNVPTRLSQVSVPSRELPEIADAVLEEITRAKTLERAVSRGELLALLEKMY